MICAPEAQADITKQLGVAPVRVETPTWREGSYSCTYRYEKGAMTLRVQQFANSPATDEFVRLTRAQLGTRTRLSGLGQDAFTTRAHLVVVRKDTSVLTVDTRGLPATFGRPPDSRENVALTVAAVIMGCWTEG